MLISKLVLATTLSMSGMALANVQGFYQTGCQSFEAEELSLIRSVDFKGSTVSQVQIIHTDLACTLPAYSFILNSTYSISSLDAIDFTSNSIELVGLEANLVASFNQSQLCGFSDWVVGEAKNVSGLICNGETLPAAGSLSYDIIKEVAGGLVFGTDNEEKDGSSIDKRPSEFDEINIFRASALVK